MSRRSSSQLSFRIGAARIMSRRSSSQLSFRIGAASISSCAPKVFSFGPKILAVHLKVYTWSHKCSQSQNKLWPCPPVWISRDFGPASQENFQKPIHGDCGFLNYWQIYTKTMWFILVRFTWTVTSSTIGK